MHSKAAAQVINCWQAAADPKRSLGWVNIKGESATIVPVSVRFGFVQVTFCDRAKLLI